MTDEAAHGLDAEFSLRYVDMTVEVVVESRSGGRGDERARNPDYDRRVLALRRRLASLEARHDSVRVESATATRNAPDPAQRRVLASPEAPISLVGCNLDELRLEIGRAVRAYTGGNNQKRIALAFTLPGTWQNGVEDLAALLDS